MPHVAQPGPNRLRELRGLRQLRLADLAEELGVSIRTVNRWERAERPIPDAQKVRLAEIFGVSVSWLMCWDDGDNGAAKAGAGASAA